MKALLSKLADQLGRLPKVVIVICGLMYEVALGIVDYGTPPSMSFTLLYLLGIAFVGWGAGKNGAALVSLVSAGIVAAISVRFEKPNNRFGPRCGTRPPGSWSFGEQAG
jgi:hypothetical protein